MNENFPACFSHTRKVFQVVIQYSKVFVWVLSWMRALCKYGRLTPKKVRLSIHALKYSNSAKVCFPIVLSYVFEY